MDKAIVYGNRRERAQGVPGARLELLGGLSGEQVREVLMHVACTAADGAAFARRSATRSGPSELDLNILASLFANIGASAELALTRGNRAVTGAWLVSDAFAQQEVRHA